MGTYEPGDQIVTTYGFDPALRHGALVRASFHLSQSRHRLLYFDYIWGWDKRSPLALSQACDTNQMAALATEICNQINNYPKGRVGVDWDSGSVFWGTDRLTSVKVSYFLGYCGALLKPLGFQILHIRPDQVRDKFHLVSTVHKKEVASVFKSVVDTGNALKNIQDPEGDIIDAIILAYLAAVGGFSIEERRHRKANISRKRVSAKNARKKNRRPSSTR